MENELREPEVAYGKNKFTIGEYLQMEEGSEEKHEYYKGEIFAMSGAKVPHNIIAINLTIQLGQKLKVNPVRLLIVTKEYIFLKIFCLPIQIFL